MSLFSKPIKTLDDLFLHTLQDIYYAENQIVKRLKQVFQMHGQAVKGVTCKATDGILDEAKEIMGDCRDAEVCDAAMLSAAQAVEHYEITRYGTLIAFANQLGRSDCASLLKQTLEEEKAADQKLTSIAESQVNRKAA